MNNEVVVLICMIDDLVQYVRTYQGATARERAAADYEVYTGVSYDTFLEAWKNDEDQEELLGDAIGTQIIVDECPIYT